MLVSERQAAFNEKHVKMLLMYMMHFGKVRNVIFRIHNTFHNEEENSGFLMHVSMQPARLNGPGGNPITSDLHKFCSMMELCPDIVLINKRMTPMSSTNPAYGNVITYDLQSINYDLDFIKSDFFK